MAESVSSNDLLTRCRLLLDEIQQFRDYLTEHRKGKEVELRHFQNTIVSEQKSIEKVRHLSIRGSKVYVDSEFILKFIAKEADTERIAHTLRSSNLRFYEAVCE